MKPSHIITALLLSSSSLAFAGNFYVAGSLGMSLIDDFEEAEINSRINATIAPRNKITSSNLDDKDRAVRLQLGYQFSPNWAIEGGYADLGKVTYSAKTNVPMDINFEAKYSAWTLAAVGIYPIRDKFSIFGKFGLINGKARGKVSVANINVSGDDTDTQASIGFGMLYHLNSNFDLRAEIEHFDTVGSLITAGVQAKF